MIDVAEEENILSCKHRTYQERQRNTWNSEMCYERLCLAITNLIVQVVSFLQSKSHDYDPTSVSLQKEMHWGHRGRGGGQFHFVGVYHILSACMVKQAKPFTLFFSDDFCSAVPMDVCSPASELAGYVLVLVCMAVSIRPSNLQCLLNFSVH